MRVGDQVTLTDYKRKGIGKSKADIYKIIKISSHTETYSSSGCLEYLILADDGKSHRCWKGHLSLIDESKKY
jgi:hypothetical protein